jgi:exosortase D (VPLPA-CTERM-specific)
LTKTAWFKSTFLVTILACFVISYLPVFQKLLIRWSTEDNSYCYLIVPLFFYFLWERRCNFRLWEFSWSPWGLLPIFFSTSLIFLGEIGSVETLMYVGIWGNLVGFALTLYGWRIKFIAFPLIILFFLVPLPPFLNRMLTFKLKIAASVLSADMLRIAGISVFQEGNILDVGIDKLQVVDACSGLRSFMSLVFVSIIIGYFVVKAWWRKTILLLMILPLSILLNGFRIFVTGWLTVNGNRELAQSLIHDFWGLLVFMMACAFLVLAAFVLRKIGPSQTKHFDADPGGRPVNPVLPWALLTMVFTLFVASGWAIKAIPSMHVIPERASFDSFPTEIGGWQGKKYRLSNEILNSLWADDYVTAVYHKAGSPNLIYLLIPFYEYQGTLHTAHTPQSCLLGSGWTLLGSDERMVKVGRSKEIKIMTMILEKGGTRLLGSYFFLQRGRVITNPWSNKFYLIYDALQRRRTDGALVRIEMTLASDQSSERAYTILENFISQLWPLLPEYVPM